MQKESNKTNAADALPRAVDAGHQDSSDREQGNLDGASVPANGDLCRIVSWAANENNETEANHLMPCRYRVPFTPA